MTSTVIRRYDLRRKQYRDLDTVNGTSTILFCHLRRNTRWHKFKDNLMAELQDVKSTRWKIQFRRDYYHYFILFIMNVTGVAVLYNSQKLRINRYDHKDILVGDAIPFFVEIMLNFCILIILVKRCI